VHQVGDKNKFIDVWSENINEINHLADLGIDGTIILKRIVKKYIEGC
jgi:hypothetical protein